MAPQKGKGKGVAMVAMPLLTQHKKELKKQREQLQTRFKELERGFEDWYSDHSLPVDTAILTVTGAAKGAAIGGVLQLVIGSFPLPLPLPQPFQHLGKINWFHKFTVLCGAEAGISCVMKRRTSCLGALDSLVCDGKLNAHSVLSDAAIYALVCEGSHQAFETFDKEPDVNYSKTRIMLSNLGLSCYEKNFQKGLLTDDTLPLLNYSVLKEVKIPPGPRLLILDHIQRDPEFQEKQEYC